jgi:ribonuclease R
MTIMNRTEFVGEVRAAGGRPWMEDPYNPGVRPLPVAEGEPGLQAGDWVHVRAAEGQAHVVRVLAAGGSALGQVYRVAANHRLDPLFPASVEEEAAAWARAPGIDDPGLADLSGLAFCTIDDATSRDLDQALCIQREGSGYRVHYALADPAWRARPGRALFDEALARGASYYLPGLMIPMLPRSLSEGVVSLNEAVDRRAIVFVMRLTADGRCQETRIRSARVRSRAKLSFERVQAFLDNPSANGFADRELEQSLRLLREVGELRIEDAQVRHVVRYRRHEVDTGVDAHGLSFSVIDPLRNDVEQYNEQLSLLCNVEGARFLREKDTEDDDTHPIYRVHPQPDPQRLAAFESMVAGLVRTHGLEPALWAFTRAGAKSLAAYLAALPTTGPDAGLARAIHRQAVLLNARSVFSETAGGHYGVGADVYGRFSAPMREIVGIFLHKEVLEKLGEVEPGGKEADAALRDQVVRQSNRARSVQRNITLEVNKLVLDEVFRGDLAHSEALRPVRTGLVLGLDARKAHIALDRPPMEVKLYYACLEEQFGTAVHRDRERVVLRRADSGEAILSLGDRTAVRVARHEATPDRWALHLVPTMPTGIPPA